jgi:asparagine synthase (glutamine-hydrolysing)
MPGIVGLITRRPRQWAEPQLRRMLAVIRHEQFYATGTWIDESCGVYIAWTAQANAFADATPVQDERDGRLLVFSGEEYRGHESKVDGLSYLLRLDEQDPSFPAGLNGRFHGLVLDTVRRTARVFNDRYGMHRLYYHEAKDAFYFGVEAKAILAVRPDLRRLDPRGLGEFVTCGCVLENRTLFDAIHVLPPASRWTFRDGSIERKHCYFEPREWEEQRPLEADRYHEALREVFSKSLPLYFNGRQGIGMSLTGGLDTRLVMAWQKFQSGSLPCYTYADSHRECRDVVVARRVARACDQPHDVIRLGGEFLSRFPYYAERSMYLTDACVDVTRASDLYLSERARTIAPVRMTGLYGDEILRPQIRAFKPMEPSPRVFDGSFLPYLSAARETYNGLIQGHPLSFAAFRQAPWHHFGILALEQTQLTVRTPFLDNEFVRTAFQAPRAATMNNDLRVRLIGDGNAALQRILTDRGFAGTGGRVSSWLSRNFLEFTFKAEYAYDYGMPQWVARVDHALATLRLERLFLGRHKLYHYRVWYRDVLSEYVKDMLLDSRTLARPYLRSQTVRTIVEQHTQGRQNYTTEIHRILSLELLHRLFIDK